MPCKTNHVAAAQSPDVRRHRRRYRLRKRDESPRLFLQFLKNYSRDLRDDKKRLIPLLGLHRQSRSAGAATTRRGRRRPSSTRCSTACFRRRATPRLDFGDYLSLIFLDTDHTSPIEGAQTDWLAKTLKEREDFPTVFAFNHVPAYPSFRPFDGTAEKEGTGEGNRKHWVPALRAVQRRRRPRAPRPHVQANPSAAGRPRE